MYSLWKILPRLAQVIKVRSASHYYSTTEGAIAGMIARHTTLWDFHRSENVLLTASGSPAVPGPDQAGVCEPGDRIW
jgi:hypothetical protein